MSTVVRRTLAVMVATIIALPALGGQALAAKSTKTVNAKSALKSLVKDTKSLPKAAASKKTKAKARLLGAAGDAARPAGKSPCSALKALSAYRGRAYTPANGTRWCPLPVESSGGR